MWSTIQQKYWIYFLSNIDFSFWGRNDSTFFNLDNVVIKIIIVSNFLLQLSVLLEKPTSRCLPWLATSLNLVFYFSLVHNPTSTLLLHFLIYQRLWLPRTPSSGHLILENLQGTGPIFLCIPTWQPPMSHYLFFFFLYILVYLALLFFFRCKISSFLNLAN